MLRRSFGARQRHPAGGIRRLPKWADSPRPAGCCRVPSEIAASGISTPRASGYGGRRPGERPKMPESYEGYARLPEDLLNDLLGEADDMVSRVEEMLAPAIERRADLRQTMEASGL